MENISKGLREQAKKNPKKIAFPESFDERVGKAIE